MSSLDVRRFTIGGSDCGAAADLVSALRESVPAASTETLSPCVEWTRGSGEYARVRIGNGRKVRMHRYIYEWHRGPLPEGYVVHHVCENKRCINIDHLRGVTRAVHLSLHDTAQRGARKQAELRLARTHCIHGHEFTPENTIRQNGGYRACRTCHKRHVREYLARKKGE